MAKIYTKFGDKGETALVGGQKVSKANPRIEAYGTVDELNSFVGWVRTALTELCKTNASNIDSLSSINADLEKLQHWLFDLGSLLASEEKDRIKYQLPEITEQHARWLEGKIDQMTAVLKPLKNFILPGGSETASRIHLCRTVTRRAERHLVSLKNEEATIPATAVIFLNRLSDYFFVLSRYANHLTGVSEVIWKKAQIE